MRSTGKRSTGKWSLVSPLVALAAATLASACSTGVPTPPISRSALEAGFDAGIRGLAIEWDPADARSDMDRRRALFAFMYETYDASAWIPQSLFDRNAIAQTVIGDVDTIVAGQVGLVRWRDNPRVPAFGMAPNTDGAPIKWTVNCLVCHTAEIDGVAYLGAGTKTFDEVWLGDALKRLTSSRWRSQLQAGSADEIAAAEANRILNAHHHDRIDSLTRARSTASERPHIFQVTAARRFDRERVGQPLYADPSAVGLDEAERLRRYGRDRNWFNVGRAGCANGGHDFWSVIKTDGNRRALIEYLKTL